MANIKIGKDLQQREIIVSFGLGIALVVLFVIWSLVGSPSSTSGAQEHETVSALINLYAQDLEIKVNPQEDVFKPYSYGLTDFPDGLFGILKKDGTYYWFIGSFPPNYKWGEDTPKTYLFRFIGNGLENMKPEPMDKKGNAIPVGEPGLKGSYDDHIFGNGFAYYDENTGKLYFWYEAMKSLPESVVDAKRKVLGDNFYPAYGSIGLAVSEDMGMTFKKKGAVLKIHLTEEKFTNDPSIPYADTIPPAIIRNGDYLYMYYNDYSSDEYKQDQIAVARLHLSDLDKSPQPWKKWFQGHFQGEALGGAFTPLFGDAAFPSVSYNTYLKKWIMVHISAEPNIFYYRTSADGLRWSPAQLLVKSDHERNWLLHPTIIGFGEDPSITGQEFWLYYAYAPNKRAEPGGWLVRRKVHLNSELNSP